MREDTKAGTARLQFDRSGRQAPTTIKEPAVPARLLHPHRRVTLEPRRHTDFERALGGDRGDPGHRVAPIPYWSSHLDPDTGVVVDSHADVAETTYTTYTTYTAFAGGRHPVTARLIVRRVRRLRPVTGQLELEVDIWRHHAVLTDRPEPLLTVEAEHRAHAVIETVIADLKNSAMAHLPSVIWSRLGPVRDVHDEG